ncbi:RecQ family ATP-dependent DNA helicase [Aeromonas caviae]|uniref:ATP-dependent DNA helicase RecQ n=1 Tax=Aeromonas caviae TaxID=648 RepID=A0AAJ6CR40_AERCA|nr:ATP-dependent DNA helicase RecQ [Aeromonas caviae]WFG00299.1 ATP-dependent DNA helicase [Aeromonas caviae]
MDSQHILQTRFGLSQFRPLQKEIIDDVLAGKDVLAVLATGGGKSLCFQLPALAQPQGLTIVVSPLIALMADQVNKLLAIGVNAAAIHGTTSLSAQNNIWSLVTKGQLPLLYVTPERLCKPEFLAKLANAHKTTPLTRFVFDEAHCVSSWGHDFRPAYLQAIHSINGLLNYLSSRSGQQIQVPISAFTATASQKVRDDLMAILFANRQPAQYIQSAKRDNLTYSALTVDKDKEKLNKLIELLNQPSTTTGSVIVYCATVPQVREVSERLKMCQLRVSSYHGAMQPGERNKQQSDWMTGETDIMVATGAFGMGIDKADVRHVIHYALPSSVDDYHQESGRAGRDGQKADATLLFSYEDMRIRRMIIASSHPTENEFERFIHIFAHYYQSNGHVPIAIDLEQMAKILGNNDQGEKSNRRTVQAILDGLVDCGFLEFNYDAKLYAIADTSKRPNYLQIDHQRAHANKLLDTVYQYAVTPECKTTFLAKYYGEHLLDDCKTCSSCVRKQHNLTLVKDGLPRSQQLVDVDTALLEELNRFRTKMQKTHKVPPFSILTEFALKQIVEDKPRSEADLLGIPGITQRKVELFGAELLGIVSRLAPVPPVISMPELSSIADMNATSGLNDKEVEEQFRSFINQELRSIRRMAP